MRCSVKGRGVWGVNGPGLCVKEMVVEVMVVMVLDVEKVVGMVMV